ncbi:MAG: hypothetical protein A2945_02550 [Candidatus Liptonbacteria bacterium RIFCSPLOWO2_01_FULL_52_25]|uniref:Uncharacterized protein n=1 Tax=Candidatus Liptonbacteria bacterium RIFCSPLOWO2_01_FULL_52_25 TaxID=1798650 RepID=A0A1G2CGS2_9BACT|nr:MAG: hypothetical protein A2945_02550 [Candidatus Liptonbacteria bacterium RIFCSPLOWO2_01_FULL_52_25]
MPQVKCQIKNYCVSVRAFFRQQARKCVFENHKRKASKKCASEQRKCRAPVSPAWRNEEGGIFS